MPYTVVKSFERGIDLRRLIDTTEMGGLLDAKDCHITRGGEIEKRAAFVVVATMPATTHGFYATYGNVFHTWGQAATAPAGMPAGSIYHSIPSPLVVQDPPNTVPPNLVRILAVEEFQGKLYVVALYLDEHGRESIIHWFGEINDTTPDMIANEAGSGSEIPVDPDDPDGETGTVDPPETPQSGAKASCTFEFEIDTGFLPKGTTITDIVLAPPVGTAGTPVSLIDSVGGPYSTANSNASVVAQIVQMKVNAWDSTPNVSAQAAGISVTLWMDEEGAQWNNWTITIHLTGWCTITNGATQTLSGGITRTGGGGSTMRHLSIDAPTEPREGLAGEPRRLGTNVVAHESKMYACNGAKLNISGFENATKWDQPFLGAGFIDFTMIAEGTPLILAMADFVGDLAIFCLRHIMIWSMDVDPDANVKRQVLHRTGLIAPHALVPYAEADVMYLDRTGIRSLRTRSGVDQAFAADLGTMIDPLVEAVMATHDATHRRFQYWAEVEPKSGRLWMVLKDQIFVLSYYPQNNIAAWTYYDATEHLVDYMNSTDDNLFWRSGNQIICYGGYDTDEYDDTEALVRLPYIDAAKMATSKNWTGIDAAVYGDWSVRASFDPMQPTALDLIANITKSTYAQQKIAMNGESPSVSLQLTTQFVGPAKIGNAAVHYTESNAD